MFKTLYGKLAAVLTLLLAGMAALYLPLSLHSTRLYLQEIDQQFNHDLAARLAASRRLIDGGEINHEMLKEVFDIYMVINPSIEVYLLDPEGEIQGFALPPEVVRRERVDMEPVRRFLTPGSKLPILGDDPRDPQRRTIFSVAPVSDPGNPDCYLYVILRGEGYQSLAAMVQESHILRVGLAALAGSLGFGLLAGLLVFRLLTRRLRGLSATMAGFGGGEPPSAAELTQELAHYPPDGDEVDRLGTTFAQMAERIRVQLEALRQRDELRRELVANASHDLRTPLAALHGYLETLQLKDANLSQVERLHYLETALRHSEHLGRLVEELFELARLEALEYRPEPEPLVMAELVQDVVQKFRHRAEAKGVRLSMNAVGPQPITPADIGMMERVLENLIENAIRHTPGEGMVEVTVTERQGELRVEVRDSGSGIPEAELPHVFERYFRGSASAGGTGLGLAIARRMVELHQGRIEVYSRPGQGACFTVILPR